METSKARERRLAAGWFDKYIKGNVIDIGCGRFGSMGIDPITPDCEKHDIDICDAHTMDAYGDEQFDTVYASHILEHMERPIEAVQSWWRILKKGGHLIISVPEMFSYERQISLPSRWNPDHKTMWTVNDCKTSIRHIHCLVDFIKNDCLKRFDYETKWYAPAITCTNLDKLNEHGNGEYSIEIILKKL